MKKVRIQIGIWIKDNIGENKMQFIQNRKDGSCDIIFSEEEVKIIKKNKKLHLSALTLKHFGNVLMKIVKIFKQLILLL